MKEEYHGLERHEGSQKLRIFLVSLGESEEISSTEVSAVQQSDPDYQYVVAVNGMGDPTRTNIGGQSLTNETSPFGTELNLAPVFSKIPNASSLFEIKDGINATGYIQLLGNN